VCLMGQSELLAQIVWCTKGPCKQVVACNYFQAVVGQLDLIGMAKVFSPWANASTPPSSYPANWKQRRPTRQSHAAAYCVLDGPIRATCLSIMVYERAHASACMELLSGCFGPTRANSPNITVHEMGPFEGLRTRAFSLIWANSTSPAWPRYSHHGPMRVPLLAAIPPTGNNKGPCSSLMQHPIVCLMGQSKLLV